MKNDAQDCLHPFNIKCLIREFHISHNVKHNDTYDTAKCVKCICYKNRKRRFPVPSVKLRFVVYFFSYKNTMK